MIRAQFVRYVAIGLSLNAALYLAYLLLSWRLMGCRGAMTITFSIGVLLSFIANRNLTFRHRGDHLGALLRFIACYAILYTVNFAALWAFAEQMGVAHQIVQGGVILALPLFAFALQKYWVFPGVTARVTPLTARAAR
jgi:putative flippase GtrA